MAVRTVSLVAVFVVWVIGCLAALGLGLFVRFEPHLEWIYAVGQLVLPAILALWVAVRLGVAPSHIWALRGWGGRRVVMAGVVAGYLLTWAAGVPAVQNELSAWSVEEYARVHPGSSETLGALPRMEVYLAIPILPGVILTYYQYTISGLYGLEAWGLHGWYGVGSTRVLEIPLSAA